MGPDVGEDTYDRNERPADSSPSLSAIPETRRAVVEPPPATVWQVHRLDGGDDADPAVSRSAAGLFRRFPAFADGVADLLVAFAVRARVFDRRDEDVAVEGVAHPVDDVVVEDLVGLFNVAD